jgi:hypothetical protein
MLIDPIIVTIIFWTVLVCRVIIWIFEEFYEPEAFSGVSIKKYGSIVLVVLIALFVPTKLFNYFQTGLPYTLPHVVIQQSHNPYIVALQEKFKPVCDDIIKQEMMAAGYKSDIYPQCFGKPPAQHIIALYYCGPVKKEVMLADALADEHKKGALRGPINNVKISNTFDFLDKDKMGLVALINDDEGVLTKLRSEIKDAITPLNLFDARLSDSFPFIPQINFLTIPAHKIEEKTNVETLVKIRGRILEEVPLIAKTINLSREIQADGFYLWGDSVTTANKWQYSFNDGLIQRMYLLDFD